MKYYLVLKGESLHMAIYRHKGEPFLTIADAVTFAKMSLEPGQGFWVCDENGGACYIGKAPQQIGNV